MTTHPLTIAQADVGTFHAVTGVDRSLTPRLVDRDTYRLRDELLMEEADEYFTAAANGDIVGVADAIADMLYIVLGTADVHGIDIGPIFAEVHRSNMTKLDEHGQPVPHPTIPGKVGKSHLYEPPNIEPLVRAQEVLIP